MAGQDPAGAAAVAAQLGGCAAAVGSDGALTPLGEQPRGEGGVFDVAVYLLDACVPADAVDTVALGRLRSAYPTVLAATGADVYPDAAATIGKSAQLLELQVVSVQPNDGTGVDDLRAALEQPTPMCTAKAVAPSGAAPNPALERADRSAYLRTTIARLRASLLAASADGFRRSEDGSEAGVEAADVPRRLAKIAAELEGSLHERLRAAYRGTFAGWPDPPEPAAPVLPRPAVPEAPAHRRRPEDAAVLVLGASAGLGIGRAVAAPLEALGAMRWLALPISLAVGLLAALWLLRLRRRTTVRAERRSWEDAASAAFRQRVEFELAAALVAAESDAALRLARGPARTSPGTEHGAGASNGYGP